MLLRSRAPVMLLTVQHATHKHGLWGFMDLEALTLCSHVTSNNALFSLNARFLIFSGDSNVPILKVLGKIKWQIYEVFLHSAYHIEDVRTMAANVFIVIMTMRTGDY